MTEEPIPTAVATVETNEPPDLRSAKPTVKQWDEANKAMRILGWGKGHTLKKIEAKRTFGKFIGEGGLHHIALTTGYETLGHVEKGIRHASNMASNKANDVNDRNESLRAMSMLTRAQKEMLRAMVQWGKEADEMRPKLPVMEARSDPPTLNVQVNNYTGEKPALAKPVDVVSLSNPVAEKPEKE